MRVRTETDLRFAQQVGMVFYTTRWDRLKARAKHWLTPRHLRVP